MLQSLYQTDMVSSAEMRRVFADQGLISAWVRVEVALADAEAGLGLVPESVAAALRQAINTGALDHDAMRKEYLRVGFPIVPLVKELARNCGPEAARWIHWGATTQDIVDTGLVLQMREGLALIESDLDQVIAGLAQLVRAHRGTVMVGRTFQQHAGPITFGYKVAIWLDELLRHRDRLAAVRERVLVCQFGGAVGTLASLGDRGLEVRRELARELGLAEPAITWHTARDSWAELVFWLASVGTTLAKIATEVAMLMRSEIDEVREPFQPGRGGSSAMPQKRNPIACPIMIAIGQRMREFVGSQLSAMIQEHERAVGAMPIEWMVIPEAFLLLSGSLRHAVEVLPSLEVDAARMRRNLDEGGGLLMAEAVMMGLAVHVGRTAAHEIVTDAARRAVESGVHLREVLGSDPAVTAHLDAASLDRLMDPSNSLGATDRMIDLVLAKIEGPAGR